jgi:hypothetical protein
MLQKGYGITITIMNDESRMEYTSKSLGVLSAHSVIKDVPSGHYVVTNMEVPLGGIIYYVQSDLLKTYFDIITVKSENTYYLGNFYGIRGHGKNSEFFLRTKTNEIPNKLFRIASNKKLISENPNWIICSPPKEKHLIIYSRN